MPAPETDVTPLRSLYVDVPLSFAYEALATATITGFAASAPTAVSMPVDSRAAKVLTAGNDRLVVAGQSIDATRSALHIVIFGSPRIYAGAGQCHFGMWAEEFRARAETRFCSGDAA